MERLSFLADPNSNRTRNFRMSLSRREWIVLSISLLGALLVLILVPILVRNARDNSTSSTTTTTTVDAVTTTTTADPLCYEVGDSDLTTSMAAARLCQLRQPTEQALVLDCANVTPDQGRDIMGAAECFSGLAGEELYQYLMATSDPFKEKYEGTCDEVCRRRREAVTQAVERVKTETEQALKDAIVWTSRTATTLKDVKSFVWAQRESTNDREGILFKLETKINGTDLPHSTKRHLVKQVKNAMDFSPEVLTSYQDIVAAVNKEIGTLKRKQSDLQNKQSYMKKKFKTAKNYLKSQSKTELIGKVGAAVESISTSIEKFSSGEPSNVISGILDVTTAISEFLPPPANAIMGPICSIFNGIFGIGGGPSMEDIIKAEFEEQKKYLEGEFKKLNEKIDALSDQLKQDAIDELVADQADTRMLLDDLLAYLRVLQADGSDGRLTKEAALAVSSQMTPALTGSKSGTGGKTEAYLKKYCRGRQAGDLAVIRSCVGLLYSYTMTHSMRLSVLARFIALLRMSDLDRKLADANREMLLVRRERLKDFMDKYLRDGTPHCNGGYRVYGCLASGQVIRPEVAPFQSYGHYAMPIAQQEFFRDLSRTLGDESSFSRCQQRALRADFACGPVGKALLLYSTETTKFRYCFMQALACTTVIHTLLCLSVA